MGYVESQRVGHDWSDLAHTLLGLGGFPGGSSIKNSPAMQELQEMWVQPLGREDPLEGSPQPTPVSLPGESHRQRSLAGYSPWGCKELDKTKAI